MATASANKIHIELRDRVNRASVILDMPLLRIKLWYRRHNRLSVFTANSLG
jgi:hypothetical protein